MTVAFFFISLPFPGNPSVCYLYNGESISSGPVKIGTAPQAEAPKLREHPKVFIYTVLPFI
jgi:hypothetical protein